MHRYRSLLIAGAVLLTVALAPVGSSPAAAAPTKTGMRAVTHIRTTVPCTKVPAAKRLALGCHSSAGSIRPGAFVGEGRPVAPGGVHANVAGPTVSATQRAWCQNHAAGWWYSRFDACESFAVQTVFFDDRSRPIGELWLAAEYIVDTESYGTDYQVEVDVAPMLDATYGAGETASYNLSGWSQGASDLTSVDPPGTKAWNQPAVGTWNYAGRLYDPNSMVRAGAEIDFEVYAPGTFVDPLRDVWADPIRCDNINQYPGCVFPQGDAVLDYAYSNYPTVIAHIARSQADGSPGAPGYPQLHRTTDQARINQNRARACPSVLVRPAGKSCDEYPFASTLEGGVGATHDMVPVAENSGAGGTLNSQLYNYQHVIDGDGYYVNVTPGYLDTPVTDYPANGYGDVGGGSGGGTGGGTRPAGDADINGDGVADLLSQYNGGDLYAYPGSGGIKDSVTSSTFGTDTDIGAWIGHRDFAIGDLNGDGRPDLLTQYNGDLFVYPGSGSVNGTTTFWSGTDIGAWVGHSHFALGDLNGDGRADLLTQYNGDHLYVYPGSGHISATTTFWSGTDIGSWAGHSNMALGDLDGDGHADLLTQFNGNMYAYPGSGHINATTTFWSGTMIGSWVGHPQFELGDINNDGHADLLSRTAAGTYYAYPGSAHINATTTFWSGTELDTTDSYDYTLGDLNGDHRPDLLYQTSDEHLHVKLGTGSITATQTSNTTLLAGTDIGPWVGHSDMARGDLNGDGIDDLLTQTANGDVYVYPGSGHINGTTTFLAGTMIGQWVGHTNLTLGDLNHDGHPDLLSQYNGNLYVYPGSGHINATTTFLAGTMIGPWIGHDHLVLGDLNGDGNADLLTQYNGADLYVYPGSGHINATTTFWTGTDIGSWAGHVDFALGDLNRDGIADLVSMTAGGDLYVYAGEGVIAPNGTFWSGKRLGPWVGHTNITL